MKRTFLKDLARESGISIPQISRALNGKPDVAPEVRQRIHELARKMNYRNRSAKHPLTVAILFDEVSEFTRDLQNEFMREASKRKIRLAVFSPKHISLLDEWLFDGAITIGSGVISGWHERFSLPLVAVNSYGHLLDRIPGVYPEGGVRLAVEHLLALGHRRIALLQPEESGKQLSRDWQKGMTELSNIAETWGIEGEVRHQFHRWEELEETVRSLLAEGFTAFYGITCYHGPRLLSVLRTCGKRVPEEVSVIAGESEYDSLFLVPPLSMVVYNYPLLVRSAIDLLLAEINGGSELRSIPCPSKLIVRNSTAAKNSPYKTILKK